MQLPMIMQWNKESVRLHLNRVSELALDSRPRRSPFVAFVISPKWKGEDRVCVLIRRKHAQAALSAPDVSRVEYNVETARLIVTGGKTRYELINQFSRCQRWQVKDELETWAKTQRTNAVARAANPSEKRAAKIQLEIDKARRAMAKIHCTRPVNPLIPSSRESFGDYCRNQESEWAEGRKARKALAKLTGQWIKRYSRPPWKRFYADAAKVLGVTAIDSSRQHNRVCNLKDGPDVIDYLRQLPKHLMGAKPYRDSDTFDLERMRTWRNEYLNAKQRIADLDAHIQNLTQAKADVLGPLAKAA